MTDRTMFDDLIALQAEITNPGFDSTNPMYKSGYTSLPAGLDHCRAVASKHSFAILQNVRAYTDNGDLLVSVTTTLQHRSGESVSFGPLVLRPGKQDVHGVIGATTYARRAGLFSALNIAGEADDDGNSALADKPSKAAPKAAAASPASWDKLAAAKSYDEFKSTWAALSAPDRAYVVTEKKAELAELRKRLKPLDDEVQPDTAETQA